MQRKTEARWGAVLGAAVALEIYALRDRSRKATFSELTRQVFRTETTCGRAVFVVSWFLLACWFPVHIIDNNAEIE